MIRKAKRISHRNRQNCKTDENFKKYRIVKIEAKRWAKEVKHKINENLHCKLGTKEGDINVHIATEELKTLQEKVYNEEKRF